MKKLAISFVTFNREKHIKEVLDIIAQPTRDFGIDIYIYDGSTNTHTEHIVKRFVEKGYNHIYYFHTDKLLTWDSVVKRVTNALLTPNAEYVWLCGDRFVISPIYYSEILLYIDKSYDIITIYGGILKGTREFCKPSRFLDYAIVPITAFGTTVIKKKLIESYDMKKICEENYSFWVPLLYLRAIANIKKFKGIVIDGGYKVFRTSRYKTPSKSRSYMWDTWIIRWNQFINLLPDAYDNIKKQLFNKPDLQMGFFSFKELLRQRSEGQFDWKKYLECRELVKKIIVMPQIYVFCISVLPKKMAKWLCEKN